MVGWGSSYRQEKTQDRNALRFHAILATIGWWPVFFQLSDSARARFPRVHKWTGRVLFCFLLPGIIHTPIMIWSMKLSLLGRIVGFVYSIATNVSALFVAYTGYKRRIDQHRMAAFRMWWLVLMFTAVGRGFLGLMHGYIWPQPNTPEGWYTSLCVTVYFLGVVTFTSMETIAYSIHYRRGSPEKYRVFGFLSLPLTQA